MRELGVKKMHKRREEVSFLWDRIIGLLEQELNWRRSRRLFVTLKEESGSYQKEIGESSALERRSLAPGLSEYIADELLERYLAEQNSVDLFERVARLHQAHSGPHPHGSTGPNRSRAPQGGSAPRGTRASGVRGGRAQ